ncbi:hypothetical protein LTR94_029888 [Friedmanniomyces endolithicus]|nr:hypothetical protein LTR94_029888 [Friedmanniomyces endolithicus]
MTSVRCNVRIRPNRGDKAEERAQNEPQYRNAQKQADGPGGRCIDRGTLGIGGGAPGGRIVKAAFLALMKDDARLLLAERELIGRYRPDQRCQPRERDKKTDGEKKSDRQHLNSSPFVLSQNRDDR